MISYAFHPDAFADLDEIWEYIAQNNVDAADRVLADIHSTLTTLAGSLRDWTSTPRPDDPPVTIPCRAR
jgi:plasmid stabilization system protein ParE